MSENFWTGDEQTLRAWTQMAHDYRAYTRPTDAPPRKQVREALDELAKLRKFVLSVLEYPDAGDYALEAYDLAKEIKVKLDETDGNA